MKRNKSKLAVVMIDIDHFKKINATYDHDIGDLVLKGSEELNKNSSLPS